VFSFQPRRIATPRTIAEVSTVITDAAANGYRVRPMGARLSWAPHLVTQDICLSTENLNRVRSIDMVSKTITVDAGVRLGEITRALARQGWCLPSLSFMPDVTIGGAAATATHGTSHKWGTLSDFVVAMTLVLPSGKIKHLDWRSAEDEFRAARVAVGMLGVAVQLELQAIDMPWVRHHVLQMDLPDFLREWRGILDRYEHVWVHWPLGTNEVKIDCLETRPARAPEFHPYINGDNGDWASHSWLKTMLRPAGQTTRAAITRFRHHNIPPDSTAPASTPNARVSMQYGVALDRLPTVIGLLQRSNFAARHKGKIMELKFLKGTEQSFLGPNADGDAVLFNAWWEVPRADANLALLDFETMMRQLHARPHWGKQHRAPDAAYMQRTYPAWERFEAIRERYDSHGMFALY
jgi:FAD/FMN-containing dehydrogenase